MSDTHEQSEDQEPEGVDAVRAALKRERARRADLETERESFQAALDREREERRAVEAQRAADAHEIGDLRAELTFTKAGVDVSNQAGRRFFEAYDGELTVEAVDAAYAVSSPMRSRPARPTPNTSPAPTPTATNPSRSRGHRPHRPGSTTPTMEAPVPDPSPWRRASGRGCRSMPRSPTVNPKPWTRPRRKQSGRNPSIWP